MKLYEIPNQAALMRRIDAPLDPESIAFYVSVADKITHN
jgi:hypothetical protein